MTKYINSEGFVTNLDTMKNPDSEFATDDYIDGFSDGISAVIKELETFPAADVAPVRHGHWVYTEYAIYGEYDFPRCSECGFEPKEEISPYCPNCGAKMDGETI